MMNKKIKLLVGALAITVMTGIGANVYADTNSKDSNKTNNAVVNNVNKNKENGNGFRKVIGKRGFDFAKDILIKEYKVSEAEITKTLNEGKNLKDLMKGKNISEEDFRKKVLAAKEKAIDEAVKAGKLDSEKAKEIKERMKENFNNGGNKGENKGKGHFKGNGEHRGTGKGNKSCTM
ncbi:hypothetical protein [Hathewaya massiliensis]|uniref:hypothetical protein n=1 Tax=Hathewaya massiliensis TaxID=1964382 RepID=UPI00115C0AEF|nr:hypothetical protein [Hathewaya massiliensis]